MSTNRTAGGPTDRELTIAGLRELADFLEANPDVPVDRYPRIYFAVDGSLQDGAGRERRAEVDRIAAALGVEPREAGHYSASRMFGPVEYHAFSVNPGPAPGLCELCARRPVHRPDAEHPRRITSRTCRECLGDGPWDRDEQHAGAAR